MRIHINSLKSKTEQMHKKQHQLTKQKLLLKSQKESAGHP